MEGGVMNAVENVKTTTEKSVKGSNKKKSKNKKSQQQQQQQPSSVPVENDNLITKKTAVANNCKTKIDNVMNGDTINVINDKFENSLHIKENGCIETNSIAKSTSKNKKSTSNSLEIMNGNENLSNHLHKQHQQPEKQNGPQHRKKNKVASSSSSQSLSLPSPVSLPSSEKQTAKVSGELQQQQQKQQHKQQNNEKNDGNIENLETNNKSTKKHKKLKNKLKNNVNDKSQENNSNQNSSPTTLTTVSQIAPTTLNLVEQEKISIKIDSSCSKKTAVKKIKIGQENSSLLLPVYTSADDNKTTVSHQNVKKSDSNDDLEGAIGGQQIDNDDNNQVSNNNGDGSNCIDHENRFDISSSSNDSSSCYVDKKRYEEEKDDEVVIDDMSKEATTANIATAEPSTSVAAVTAQSLINEPNPTFDRSNINIEYKQYESELQMQDIMRLIQSELSEPYSIYTYRYFIYNWPKLCFLAAHENEYVGAIVCKLDMHMNVKRGYIAMLAVKKEYRKLRIGTNLVEKAIEAMLADNADEVVLETEMKNIPALRLYENLGFVRDKRLFRYYLNGVDALRLKLWFR